MSINLFLTIYLILLLFTFVLEVYILLNNKNQHLRVSYKSLKNICEKINATSEERNQIMSKEIFRFYNEYIQEIPRIKKYFPNVVVWIDAIIFRVNYGGKNASILQDYIDDLKKARDLLEENNPYNKCERYQQEILCDLSKLQTTENEIVVQNIINRTEEEFLRLSVEVKKNNILNMISIILGVTGIIVSILMAFVKF